MRNQYIYRVVIDSPPTDDLRHRTNYFSPTAARYRKRYLEDRGATAHIERAQVGDYGKWEWESTE